MKTDDYAERINALLECYLRHYVSEHPKDWARILDMTQFSFNLQRKESTECTPFEFETKQHPQTLHLFPTALKGKSLGAYHLAKGWE